MLRTLYRIRRIYNAYKLMMWVTTMSATILIPAVSYLVAFLQHKHHASSLLEDNPELASQQPAFTVGSWWTNSQSLVVNILHWLVPIFLVLILLLLFLAVANRGQKNTRRGFVDYPPSPQQDSLEQPTEDDVDDYGV